MNYRPWLASERAIGDSKACVRSFLRSDHLSNPTIPLADELRQAVQVTQRDVDGPIRLLTICAASVTTRVP